MIKPSKEQKENINTLFREGYKNAANSFSTFSGKNVNLANLEIIFSDPEALLKKITIDADTTVLITEIIGEAKGKSYLLLNRYEVEKINQILLSKLKNSENNDAFREIILKELDNVLAASVITHFSNFLDLKIYGDVPLLIKPEENTQQWFKKELEKVSKMYTVVSSVCFTSDEDARLHPTFIWILDNHFYSVLEQKINTNEINNL